MWCSLFGDTSVVRRDLDRAMVSKEFAEDVHAWAIRDKTTSGGPPWQLGIAGRVARTHQGH
eukprot:920823-Alexandrium_andersonii.AAC.1